MTVSIRLLGDWGPYPFYVDEGNGLFEIVEPEDFQPRFNLPDHVMCALLSWDEVYQAVIN